jgi:hypothetical protein
VISVLISGRFAVVRGLMAVDELGTA